MTNDEYRELVTTDTYHHVTHYMGTVDDRNRVNFYDGTIRVWDCTDWNEVAQARAPANSNAMFVAFSPDAKSRRTNRKPPSRKFERPATQWTMSFWISTLP